MPEASSVNIDGMALKLTNLEIHLVVSAHWESAPLTVPRFAQLAGSVHPCFQATWRSCPMTLSVPFSRSMPRHCSPSASLSQAEAGAMTHRAPVRVAHADLGIRRAEPICTEASPPDLIRA